MAQSDTIWDTMLRNGTGQLKHQLERKFTRSQPSYRQPEGADPRRKRQTQAVHDSTKPDL